MHTEEAVLGISQSRDNFFPLFSLRIPKLFPNLGEKMELLIVPFPVKDFAFKIFTNRNIKCGLIIGWKWPTCGYI